MTTPTPFPCEVHSCMSSAWYNRCAALSSLRDSIPLLCTTASIYRGSPVFPGPTSCQGAAQTQCPGLDHCTSLAQPLISLLEYYIPTTGK